MNSLRRQRISKGYTLTELSKMTEVSPNFISEIETGRHGCSFKTLEKLVYALSDTKSAKFVMPATKVRSR